jgi:hypothetical protein
MSEQSQMTFEQYISTMRNQIVLSYDGAKEVALRNFDDLTKKFAELYAQQQAQQPQDENKSKSKKK